MVYYQIDNKIYYLDLNRVFELTSETPSSERVVNTTITQYYGMVNNDSDNNGKEIVESKSSMNDTMNNLRYDFIKNIVNCLLIGRYDESGMPINIGHLNEMTFPQGLCFNTLIEHKILVEVETDDERED